MKTIFESISSRDQLERQMQGSIRIRHEHFPVILTDVDSGDSGVETIQRELIGLWNLEHDAHEPTVKPAVTDDGDAI